MRARRPWYGFLYYLLGAQGSFFVWVACLLGLYLTRKEAALYALNREPVATSVRSVVAGDMGFRRWLGVSGIEIDLETVRAALDENTPLEGIPVAADTVLVDPGDRAAAAWGELLKRFDTLAAEPLTDPELLTTRLWQLVHVPREDPPRFRPAQGLVVVPGTNAPAPAGTATSSAGSGSAAGSPAGPTATASPTQDDPGSAGARAFGAWLARARAALEAHVSRPGYDRLLAERLIRKLDGVAARAAELRRAVRPGVAREGLLHRLPGSKVEGYRNHHAVGVAHFALVTGQRPHYLAASIFGGLAVLQFFLVVGLFALRAPPRDPQVPVASATD
jgi:hypothetical protein